MFRLLINRLCNKCLNKNFNYNFESNPSKLFPKLCQSIKFCTNVNNESNDKEFETLLRDRQYHELYPRNWNTLGRSYGVLVVMARQKWGRKHMHKDFSQQLMAETVTLINTLPNMIVIDSVMISTLDVNKKLLFGSGNSELLKKRVKSDPKISAVVFAIDMLSSIQQSELEHHLGIDVYDRFSIVLQIFKHHARTKEAKLQIALSEIPYIRSNLRVLQKSGYSRNKDLFTQIGGSGETWIRTRKQLLDDREIKLKKLLDKIHLNRGILRAERVRKQIPLVAVCGYTNAGKTSLIKALTNDARLVPKDHLFATLDVTVHKGRLHSNMDVLFTDTIGFISQIPTNLIQSFRATLSEVSLADVIVHVFDLSHPNFQLQRETVYKTLDEIEVPAKLKDTMIEVANKVDLVTDQSIIENCDQLLISATKGNGLNQLLKQIERTVIENTNRLSKLLRVPNGGPEYQWLLRETAVRNCDVDQNDNNYLILHVLITNQVFEKFKNIFKNNYTEVLDKN